MQGTLNSALQTSRHAIHEASAEKSHAVLRKESVLESRQIFASAVSQGLNLNPRRLESRFLYDARGSLLFDLITRLPEYYLTRTEASILAASAGRIRELTGPVALVELGSGSSEKTDYLLGAWLSRDKTVSYIPVDVSESALRRAGKAISRRHPAARVVGMHGDYHHVFPHLREASPVMTVFLGSSIGNFDDEEMSRFLGELSGALSPADFFLAGFDLVKDPDVIEAAYNDAAGITQEFTRNLFVRMNRELQSGIDTGAVKHLAGYSSERQRIEIDACFTRKQEIRNTPLGERYVIGKGESIRTEISRKFRLETLIPYLESFGFRTREVFTDPRDWFALVLVQKK